MNNNYSNNSNSNNSQKPLLEGINQHPIINMMLIVVVVILIILYNYLKKNPKLFGSLFAIILIIGLITFIFRFFNINFKKALMIIFFVVIAIVLSILILDQGDYIKFDKKTILLEEGEEGKEGEDEIEDTVLKYTNIECFNNNNEYFENIKGPCFNEKTGFGYSYLKTNDCENNTLEEQYNDKLIYSNLDSETNPETDSETNYLKCVPFNKYNKDNSCNSVIGGFNTILNDKCSQGYASVKCQKNYNNGKKNYTNSSDCLPLSTDFDYECKESNSDKQNFQSIGAKKYLPCSLDNNNNPNKYEAICDYGYSNTKNLYYNYTPCLQNNTPQKIFDNYCQKKYNVNSTNTFNYDCPINFKRSKCNL